MERLISSASRATAPLHPHRLLPRPRSVSASPPPSLYLYCRVYFKPAAVASSQQEGLLSARSLSAPCSVSSSAASNSPPFSEQEAPRAASSSLVGDGASIGASVQKIVKAAGSILLTAFLLTIVQPIFAPPAYAAATIQSAVKSGGKLLTSELLSSAWAGFFAGCLHTLTGPDHLAALAPLSIGRTRIQSAAVGALWGCGHDAGQLIFGLLFLLLKDRLHIEVLRTWGTRVVGLTLLAIGAIGIREASEVPVPCVALENGECDVSMSEGFEVGISGKKKKIGFATFATGVVHGLQPDALMMILPALALPSRLAGAAFLGMFLLGTVFSMGSYTAFIGSCTQALKERVPRITEKLTWAASLVAISLGLSLFVGEFFGFSLY